MGECIKNELNYLAKWIEDKVIHNHIHFDKANIARKGCQRIIDLERENKKLTRMIEEGVDFEDIAKSQDFKPCDV